MRSLLYLLCTSFVLSTATLASDRPVVFERAEDQKRYEFLLEELRCLVCQNQSLADSQADLAQDMRDEVQRMIDSGLSNDDITEFLSARYGDFVLYRPPMKRTTWLLWGGPFVMLALAIVIVVRLGRRPRNEVQPLSEKERTFLASIARGDHPEQ